MADPQRCSACDATLPADARFCPRCGRAMRTELADTELGREPAPTTLPPMRLRPGTMLSVYRIEDVVGEGGMGVVYRAHDTATGRAVAVKCLHTNLAGDPHIRQRFMREARVLRVWSHPGAVAIYDFVEHEHLLAIVMELVAGESLVKHLSRWRGRMPYGEIRQIMGPILVAMEDAHDNGVVHRDLKPDNILVSSEGGRLKTKLVDFGIAKILEGTTYTVSGALLGTCMYMAPEQVKTPSATDHRADIYSLGVTLYELVCGRPPFDGGGSHFAVMMAHVSQRPRSPSKLRDDVPPALERLILDSLAKDPSQRPQSCAIFRERLFEAIDEGAAAPAEPLAEPLAETIHETNGHEMVLVPAGPFAMCAARREVYLDAFYVDRTPVTNEQFKVFVDATGYAPTDEDAKRFLAHWRNGKIPRGEERHPVVYVSWIDARAYAAWAGKRLPTEAEWEKAARGTDGRKYPWGRVEPTAAHASFGRRDGGTTRVGSFPEGVSPYGVLDLAGNVWEWCEDVEDEAFYETGPTRNPKSPQAGSKSGMLHVMRGGSWMYDAGSLRTYARTGFETRYRFAGGGFRCARTPG
ncbi:MAG: SUMF1/EgtB/PvdO family nonheme iron enzyme [Labilithrix sp.]|nr:SUMF1/EgtB/PvdO family nonheme iron enzyme [Labilithrix sp.]